VNSFIQLFNRLLKVYDVDFALMTRAHERTLKAGKRLKLMLRLNSRFSVPDSRFFVNAQSCVSLKEASLLIPVHFFNPGVMLFGLAKEQHGAGGPGASACIWGACPLAFDLIHVETWFKPALRRGVGNRY